MNDPNRQDRQDPANRDRPDAAAGAARAPRPAGRKSRWRRRSGAVLPLAAAVLAAGAAGAAGAAADPVQAPDAESAALSINIGDGVDGIAPGDETTYTVTLRNDGAESLSDVLLTQGLPPEMELVDASGDTAAGAARTEGGLVAWRVSLEPGQTATGTVTARLADAGERTWRVASTACAQTDAGAPPVVCATDADLLPEAPKADASPDAAPKAEAALPSPSAGEAAIGAASLGLIGGAAVFYTLGRRRAVKEWERELDEST
ncbi:hypothetical protein [Nocardiopsis coralliicola]